MKKELVIFQNPNEFKLFTIILVLIASMYLFVQSGCSKAEAAEPIKPVVSTEQYNLSCCIGPYQGTTYTIHGLNQDSVNTLMGMNNEVIGKVVYFTTSNEDISITMVIERNTVKTISGRIMNRSFVEKNGFINMCRSQQHVPFNYNLTIK